MNNNNKNNDYYVVPTQNLIERGTICIFVMFDIPKVLDFSTLLKSYFNCLRRKHKKEYAVDFHIRSDILLEDLMNAINSRTYKINPSTCFGIALPKFREIWAAEFVDRIPQTLMVDLLTPYYVPRFIETTYSCIKDRGTHKAREKAIELIESISNHYTKDAWILKMDITNYFGEINKNILWGIYEKDLPKDSVLTDLLKQIIFNNPTENPIIRNSSALSQVPYKKRLANSKKDCGLPIGNITSQFSGNVYLDEIDHWSVKYGIKGYVRYVDDILVIDDDLERLKRFEKEFKERLWETRQLTISDEKSKLVYARDGIMFLGAKILPNRTYTRNFTLGKVKSFLNTFEKEAKEKTLDELAEYLPRINSWLGLLRGFNEFKFRRRMCERIWKASTGRIHYDKEYTKMFVQKK